MRKLVLLLVSVLTFTAVVAQKNVRQTASNFLKEGKLDKALESINQCVQDPSTAQDAKAWFLRGSIYLEVFNSKDEKYKALDPDPVSKAIDSYKKAHEFDTKKEFAEDIFAKVNWLRNNFFNQAVDFYNKKQFRDAMSAFETGANALSAVDVQDTLALFYAAACASRANDRLKAKEIYIKLLNQNAKSVDIYNYLSDLYRIDKDSSNALKIIRQGQKLYPNDLKLFLAETNIYLTFGNTDKALRNLKVAIKKDSSNSTVFFALGTIYDNISNDTNRSGGERAEAFNNAINAYQSALRINPDYFEANYNLGALFVNKAAVINDQANKLTLDASAEFNKLKAEADHYLEQALPYLEKASELQPGDVNTLYSLKQIYARTNKPDKLKEINNKIEGLQKK